MLSQTLELSPRSDGARYRRVTLSVDRDGALTLMSLEVGGGDLDVFGLDDLELTLHVPPTQVGRLALALAAELLADGEDAVSRLSDICDKHGVDCRVACWS